MKNLEWNYGEMIMTDDETITEWSDDMEMMGRICDQTFDYLWNVEDGKITLTDRQYSDGNIDDITEERIQNGTAVLKFTSFTALFSYFLDKLTDKEQIAWVKQRIQVV